MIKKSLNVCSIYVKMLPERERENERNKLREREQSPSQEREITSQEKRQLQSYSIPFLTM